MKGLHLPEIMKSHIMANFLMKKSKVDFTLDLSKIFGIARTVFLSEIYNTIHMIPFCLTSLLEQCNCDLLGSTANFQA